ncbi:MAG: efflux RND transporter periplasmic adaptor subunit [Pseudomonadota bacterium]
MRRSLARLLVLATALGAATGGIAWLHARAATPETATAAPLPVAVAPVVLTDHFVRTVRYTGRIEAARETTLAFEQGGLVIEMLVDEGDRVAAGAPLARQDSEIRTLERRRLAGERAATAAQIELARRTEDRQRALSGRGFSADQAHDEARFQRMALEAEAEALDAAIARLDAEIADAILAAPFAGTIGARHLDEGVVAAAGTPALDILETSRLQARIGVPAALAGAVAVGENHRVDVDGRAFTASLARKRVDLVGATRTVTLIFDVVVPDGVAPPALGELAALVRTEHEPEAGFWVPLAVLEEGAKGLWRVPIVVEDDSGWRRRAVAVEIVHAELERVFVRGAMPSDAHLLVAGAHRVPNGAAVEPLEQLSPNPSHARTAPDRPAG